MIDEFILEDFPKTIAVKGGLECELRLLQSSDEQMLHEFFRAIPYRERMFIKHQVADRGVIHDWCSNIDVDRNLPLVAVADGRILADSTLHQQLGGWKGHIGRVSVLVHPEYRGLGLAKALISETIELARNGGLQKVEAEFIGEQEAAVKLFAMLGFSNLLRLEDYVRDLEGITHDYILMGMNLKTDEEYAGME
jgi:ribosomal protein S18 acetylase RimI-like enzyme